MKTIHIFAIIFPILATLFAVSCTPTLEHVEDNRKTDVSLISKVVLKPNSQMLVADGNAQINLTPLVYVKEKNGDKLLTFDRVQDEWLEYTSASGEKVSRYFSTSDQSLVGKTMSVSVKIKGTTIVSNTASFKIVEKLTDQSQEAVFPVVFHIIQTSKEIEQFAVPYDKQLFYDIINKFNNVFGGKLSRNPVGTDARIRFRAAEYSPSGERLTEAGINRVAVGELPSGADVNDSDKKVYDKIIEYNNLVWNPARYLNIWLISDVKGSAPFFGSAHSTRCKPRYAYKDTAPVKGLDLREYSADSAFSVAESGVLYKLQLLNERIRPYDYYGYIAENNELIYYVGQYMGLLPNNSWGMFENAEDYCDDTTPYIAKKPFYRENKTAYKETAECFFLSENIMDDPTGMHISVSQNQCQRVWQVLKTCPERAAWKSTFAFEGK